VGKYLMTLVVFPLQRERNPSSLTVRAKQSPIPLYGSDSLPALMMASWFCSSIFTRSTGAARVLDTDDDTPPRRKSAAKFLLFSFSAGADAMIPAAAGKAAAVHFRWEVLHRLGGM
jgi:hypothetical protein